MNRFCLVLILWLISGYASTVTARFTLPPYRHFTLRDGLPQMQVISLFQDSRGYLWVGTKAGICCYNGSHFNDFSRNPLRVNDLVYSITEDSFGNIWFFTPKGLELFDGRDFRLFASDKMASAILTADEEGRVWFLGHNGSGEIMAGYFLKGEYHFLPHNLQHTDAGLISGIAYCKQDKSVLLNFHTSLYEIREGKFSEIHSGTDTLIFCSRSPDTTLIASVNNLKDVGLFSVENGKMKRIARFKDSRNVLNEFTQGTIYLTDYRNQLPVMELTPAKLNIVELYGIKKNCFLRDRDGQFWVGSEDGLYLLQDNGFETFRTEYLPQVWSVTEDNNGNIWFASFHFGLKKYDGTTVQSYPELKSNNLAAYFHFRSSGDKQGHLYFPNGSGILRYDGKRFDKISDEVATSTFYDAERDLLLGGFLGNFQVFGPGRTMIRKVGEEQSLGIKRWIVAMGMDAEGWYWLGSLSGAARYHYESGEIIVYNRNNGRLPADGITSVHTDQSGRTWMGSTGGLLYYEQKTGEILKIDHEDLRGPVNLVNSVDTTWLLLSQSEGIYLLDMNQYRQNGSLSLFFFNQNNGYLGIEPGQDGAFKDSKGNIWMTSSTEVVKLNPAKLRPGTFRMEIRISSVNDQLLAFGDESATLEKNQQVAVITFDAVCFSRPKPTQYSWRVEGRNWSDWREEEYAIVPNLPSGASKLELRARTPGLSAETYATDSIEIRTAVVLWKQAWFFQALFGLFAFLVLIAILLIYRYRIKIMKTSRDARIAQIQAIQSQMNPHFVFNALASLQTMILNADLQQANTYLLKLASLIRGFLDASAISGNSIKQNKASEEKSLSQELDILQSYVDFQQLIYPGRFTYNLSISPEVDVEKVMIPPMRIQPLVENAIRHGLLPRQGAGSLALNIGFTNSNELTINVVDDGIGIRMAEEKSRRSTLRYISRGRELTMKRISLLNELGYNIRISTNTSDQGTTVTLKIHTNDES
jgi:hypothetical protein